MSASAAAQRWAQSPLERANQIDDWIAIAPDGTVTVMSGKVELGTGVRTALAQIAAEELDVPVDRIRMVMGDTGQTPDEGYTAGSMTILSGGSALRQASAEARLALLEMASDRLDAALDELVVRDGVVSVNHHPDRTVSYAELIGGKRFDRAITGRAPVKRPEEYRVVGRAVPRVDLPDKFTGVASFVQDLRLPGMLHGRVVRPPGAGARLISIDENSVQNARVVRLGNFVGVVSEREEQAVRAAQQLKVQWQETAHLPPMGELFDYLRQVPVTDQVVTESGHLADALKRVKNQVSATYYTPYQAHASLGPSCAVAEPRGDEMVVWCNTQGAYPLRGALADLLQMPPERVRVIHVEGAGSYGQNGIDDAAADAAVLARAVGKPVRVQWSRQDEFAWEPYVPAMVLKLQGGVDDRGNVIAWDYQGWSPTHGNRARDKLGLVAGQLIYGQIPPPRSYFIGGDRNAPTNYVFANQRVTMHWQTQSPLRESSFRSLGATANTFANESFMDELAAAAHGDPVEFRLRHLQDPRAIAIVKAVAAQAGWGTPLPAGEGRGVAFARYKNREAYLAAVAHVRVDKESGQMRVLRVTVAYDCGLIINPDGLKNQIEGNVVQSMSRAMKEQVTWDDSHITSVDWETYPILTFSEVPDIEVVLINRPDQPAVGAGEPGSITTAPAIANAIYAATGARVRQIPFVPQRIKAALGQG